MRAYCSIILNKKCYSRKIFRPKQGVFTFVDSGSKKRPSLEFAQGTLLKERFNAFFECFFFRFYDCVDNQEIRELWNLRWMKLIKKWHVCIDRRSKHVSTLTRASLGAWSAPSRIFAISWKLGKISTLNFRHLIGHQFDTWSENFVKFGC